MILTVTQAVNSLKRKGLKETETGSKKFILQNKGDLGNGSWGRIDYLKKQGYKFGFQTISNPFTGERKFIETY